LRKKAEADALDAALDEVMSRDPHGIRGADYITRVSANGRCRV
jgi:hypothetical protein